MTSIYNAAVHLPPLGKSDHQCLLVKPKKQVKVKPILRNVRIMCPINIAALTIRMNDQNWNQVLDARDVDQKVDIFTQLTTNISNETVPMKRIRMHPSDKPWLTPYMRSVIKDRQRAYSKGDMEKYQQLRIQVSQLISKAKLEYYKDKVATTRTKNPAKWFKSIYSICATSGNKSNSNIPTSEDMYTIAEKLQDIFTKPWKYHTRAIPLVDADGLHDNPPPFQILGKLRSY